MSTLPFLLIAALGILLAFASHQTGKLETKVTALETRIVALESAQKEVK